jgi:hypothetical protein
MHRTLKYLEAELSGSLMGLTAEQTGCAPRHDAEKWTVQEIVEHLLLTYQSTVGAFEARIAKGRPTRATASVGQRMIQFYVVRLARFPSGRMAPEEVIPRDGDGFRSGEDLVDCVQMELARLDAVCEQASKVFGSTPAVRHGLLGPMSVDRWRTFHLVHGEHHVRQILALRREQGC